MKRALLLTGIVLLGSFYLFVISKIFQPEVSERYRAYYIDKRLKYWNDGITPLNQPGTAVDLTLKAPQLSADGWSSPDTSGTRFTKSPASIFLQLDTAAPPPTDLVIESCSCITANTSPIEITVLVNNHPVGILHYEPNMNRNIQAFAIPARALTENRKQLTVTFRSRNNLRSAIIRIKRMTLTAPGYPDEIFIEQVKGNGI